MKPDGERRRFLAYLRQLKITVATLGTHRRTVHYRTITPDPEIWREDAAGSDLAVWVAARRLKPASVVKDLAGSLAPVGEF